MKDPWTMTVIAHSDKDEVLIQSQFTSAYVPLSEQTTEDLLAVEQAIERELDRRADRQCGADS